MILINSDNGLKVALRWISWLINWSIKHFSYLSSKIFFFYNIYIYFFIPASQLWWFAAFLFLFHIVINQICLGFGLLIRWNKTFWRYHLRFWELKYSLSFSNVMMSQLVVKHKNTADVIVNSKRIKQSWIFSGISHQRRGETADLVPTKK